jgi:P4 family phage/plasmid primase-like protien
MGTATISERDVHGNGEPVLPPAESDAIRFLHALFEPGDWILTRPIETWTDNGQKRSRVDYQAVQYWPVGRSTGKEWIRDSGEFLGRHLRRQLDRAAAEKTNLFFGVCPRLGPGGAFDQAWQIRTVRVLWNDVDHCTPDDAFKRCEAAGLPRPTILVNSGNGCHPYWLLSEPYLIDDAEAPPPVHTEFVDQGEGKKKKRRLYIQNGSPEKIYVDTPGNRPALSPKAQLVQDVVAGIASKIGGDHTQDLSRILRLPGTMNRKDQRNGREPVPCTLVECDPTRRYSFSDFQRFATESPDRKRREQVAKVPLPTPRKLTAGKKDKLAEFVLACGAAAVGQRSKADYSLCAWAIEHGVPQAEVWAQVQEVGKFKERGESYFQLTWDKAAQNTREKIWEKATKAAGTWSADNPADSATADKDPGMVKMLADFISAGNYFAQDAGGRLYHYANGVYQARGENYVRREVKRLCIARNVTKAWSTRLANEVAEFIRVDAPQLWERPRLDVLNVKNGLLRIADRVLLPHTPEHLSSVQLPVEYDHRATCPAIDKFVNQVFPTDATALAWEIPGWLMLPDMAIQKAILLLGEGSNGKSTWLCLITTFLGKGNVSGLALHKLEADKFAAARLIGRLANICPDLPSEHLAGTSTFKAITGGDTLTAEYKFKDSFDFTPFCRLVFSANHPPRSKDASFAFFRRWLCIPFDRTFGPDEETPEIPRDILDAMLTTPAELSGLLNRTLDALDRLRINRRFSEPESVQRAWQEFHAETDPLSVWLDQTTIEIPDGIVPKAVLIAAYNRHAASDGLPSIGNKRFGQALRRLRENVGDGQRMVNGKYVWCYIGLALIGGDCRCTEYTQCTR